MSKHLVDIDEQALRAARAEMGTRTIKETVNRALQTVGTDRRSTVEHAFATLAEADVADRERAWR